MRSLRQRVTGTVLLGLATTVASIGFVPVYAPREMFGSWAPVALAVVGILIGAVVAILGARSPWPWPAPLIVGVSAAIGVGSVVVFPEYAIWRFLPSFDGILAVLRGSVFSWRDVLTVAPPIGAPVETRVLPFVCGCVASFVSTSLLWRMRATRPERLWLVALAGLPPFLVLGLTIVVGTAESTLGGLRGVLVASLVLVWAAAVRAPTDDAVRQRSGLVDRASVQARDAVVSDSDGTRTGTATNALSIRSGLLARRTRAVFTLLTVAAIVGFLGSAALPLPERVVARDSVVPPLVTQNIPSPLAGFRTFTKDRAEEELFRVSGVRPRERIRIAAMTGYDGRVWSVSDSDGSGSGVASPRPEPESGTFRATGEVLDPRPPSRSDAMTTRSFEMLGYDGLWLPLADGARTIAAATGERDWLGSVRYSLADAVGAVSGGVPSRASYSLVVEERDSPADDRLASVPIDRVALPELRNVPESITAYAEAEVDPTDAPIAQLRTLEQRMRTAGYLSHGLAGDTAPSAAGHGADRMESLLGRSHMVGDQEQYASAFALMARSLGYPSRVVLGFARDDAVSRDAESTTYRGADVTAWVEVPFEGVGWIAFDPTPDDTEVPSDEQPEPHAEPEPQIRQPPRVDSPADDLLGTTPLNDRSDEEESETAEIPAWLVIGGIGAVIPLAVLCLVGVIAGYKWLRRLVRSRVGRSDRLAAAAWDEFVDRVTEAGIASPSRAMPRRARAEAVAEGVAELPVRSNSRDEDGGAGLTPDDVLAFADDTDAMVFRGDYVGQEIVSAFWDRSATLSAAVVSGLSRSARLRLRFRFVLPVGISRRRSSQRSRLPSQHR